ncbi:hypothetical protein Tco_0083677, partial [Tanacetum coccineum]
WSLRQSVLHGKSWQAFVDYASLSNNKVGVIILRKEDEVKEEENVKPNATEYNDHEMTAKVEEKVEEESEDEFEEEIEEEEEKEEEDVEYFDSFPSLEELRYHEWLLKYPKPSWEQAYIDLASPVNVMSRLHYNWIMSDTTSIVDHDLGAVVFRKPFTEKTRLIYDKKEGTVAFEDNNEKIILKMPHKMEMFKNVDFIRVGTKRIPPFIIGGNSDDNEKTHYTDNLNLGPEYKYDESICKSIQSLIRTNNMRKSKGEVMKFFKKNKEEIFTVAGDGVRIYPDGVTPSDT